MRALKVNREGYLRQKYYLGNSLKRRIVNWGGSEFS